MFSVSLPPAISTNRLYRSTRNARGKPIRVKTPEARQYERDTRSIVEFWFLERGGYAALIPFPKPPFRLTFTMHPASSRRIDASNCVKLAEDAIFKALGLNDRTVTDISIHVGVVDTEHPRLDVTLGEAR